MSEKKDSLSRRARYAKAGMCHNCGQRPPVPERAECSVCRAKGNQYLKNLSPDRRTQFLARARASFQRHRGKRLQAMKAWHRRVREEVLEHYGGRCACCNEERMPFLCIDHVNGRGNAHRRSLGAMNSGAQFYRWLMKAGFPLGFRVMCHNCNFATAHSGICPHQE